MRVHASHELSRRTHGLRVTDGPPVGDTDVRLGTARNQSQKSAPSFFLLGANKVLNEACYTKVYTADNFKEYHCDND